MCGSDGLSSSSSLLICGNHAAVRQKIHLTPCPVLRGQLSPRSRRAKRLCSKDRQSARRSPPGRPWELANLCRLEFSSRTTGQSNARETMASIAARRLSAGFRSLPAFSKVADFSVAPTPRRSTYSFSSFVSSACHRSKPNARVCKFLGSSRSSRSEPRAAGWFGIVEATSRDASLDFVFPKEKSTLQFQEKIAPKAAGAFAKRHLNGSPHT